MDVHLQHTAPKLDATTVGRTAPVVGQRRNINDFEHLDTGSVNGTDRRLTAGSGPLHIHLYLAQTHIVSHLGAILSGSLSSIGRIFLRTAETHLPGRAPADHFADAVGEGYNHVVEGRVDMGSTHGVNLDDLLFNCSSLFFAITL